MTSQKICWVTKRLFEHLHWHLVFDQVGNDLQDHDLVCLSRRKQQLKQGLDVKRCRNGLEHFERVRGDLSHACEQVEQAEELVQEVLVRRILVEYYSLLQLLLDEFQFFKILFGLIRSFRRLDGLLSSLCRAC